MYKVEAIIRSHKLEEVQEALEAIDFHGITVTDVRGMGKQKGVTHTYRGSQYTLSLSPRLKVEVWVLDKDLEEVVAAIEASARTGEIGDGKILVTPLSQVVRIRTGERGEIALS
jgi:nitrogen regulatory protein P-II 1